MGAFSDLDTFQKDSNFAIQYNIWQLRWKMLLRIYSQENSPRSKQFNEYAVCSNLFI